MSNQGYSLMLEKLDGFIRKYYKNELIKGAILATGLAVLLFVVVSLLEYAGHFDTTIRTTLFYTSMVAFGLILGRFIALPLLKLNRIGRTLDHKTAARIVGNHFPDIDDKLLNTLQLGESGGNTDLLMASIDQRVDSLSPVPFTSAIDFGKNKRYLKYAVPPLVVLISLWVIDEDILKESTNRLINYETDFIPPAPFEFTLVNQDMSAVQNEEIEIRVKVAGSELPSDVSLVRDGSRFRMRKLSKVEYAYTLRPDESMDFHFVSGEVRSRTYRMEVRPRPVVRDFTVELSYPKYTGRVNEVLSSIGDLSVPEGTIAKWRFNTENVSKLIVDINDKDTALDVRMDASAVMNRMLNEGFRYTVFTTNEFINRADSMSYLVQVRKDAYPTIRVEEDVDTTNENLRYFGGSIEDDYGFSALRFTYTYKNGKNKGKTESLPVAFDANTTIDDFLFFWDIQKLNLEPGDEITYHFTVWDNDGVNGSKSARSGSHVYKMPTLDEMEEKHEQSTESTKSELSQAMKEAAEISKQMKELKNELSNSKSMSWQQRQKLEDLVNRQLELQNKVERANEQFKKSNKDQEKYKEFDKEFLEKRDMLNKLMDELFTPEMKEMLKELQELMKEMNKEGIEQSLDEMEHNNEQVEKEMERFLEHMKQLEFEAKAKDLQDKAEELAKDQEELSEQTKDKELTDEEALERQKELNERMEEIKEDLEKLKEKNEELERKHDMEEAEESAEETEKEQQEATEKLQEGKQKKASESQKKAAEQAKEMAEQMESMQGSGGDMEQLELDYAALRQLLENLIDLSLDQEQAMNDISGLDKHDPRYFDVGRKQRKLMEDAEIIEDSLFALSKRVIQIEPIVNREIGEIHYYMEKTLDDIGERRTYEARSKQQYAMTSINNLALLLDEVMQQMQQNMMMASGSGSCSKPGSGKPSSMPSLRQMQEQLAEQIKKAKDGMKGEGESGKKPGQSPGMTPGQQGKPGMGNGENGESGEGQSEQLAKLAAQQAAIREQIKQLKQQLNEDGSGGGNGLNKVIQDMEKTEEDIIFNRINQQTIERQKDILTRLLEHEKAERERDWDEKRESHEAKNDEYGNPDRVLEYKRKKEKELELLKTIPPDLRRYYRNKVNTYFNSVE